MRRRNLSLVVERTDRTIYIYVQPEHLAQLSLVLGVGGICYIQEYFPAGFPPFEGLAFGVHNAEYL